MTLHGSRSLEIPSGLQIIFEVTDSAGIKVYFKQRRNPNCKVSAKNSLNVGNLRSKDQIKQIRIFTHSVETIS